MSPATASTTADRQPRLDDEVVDPLAAYGRAWGVLVTSTAPDGRTRARRTVYLTPSAAHRAVEAARDRGHTATAVLLELRPLAIVEALT